MFFLYAVVYKMARQFDDARRAGGVVVGAIVDFARGVGLQRIAVVAKPKVVVVRPDDDGVGRAVVQKTHHVLAVHLWGRFGFRAMGVTGFFETKSVVPALVFPFGRQARLFELFGDVFGGFAFLRGARAAALQFVGSQVGEVFL